MVLAAPRHRAGVGRNPAALTCRPSSSRVGTSDAVFHLAASPPPRSLETVGDQTVTTPRVNRKKKKKLQMKERNEFYVSNLLKLVLLHTQEM